MPSIAFDRFRAEFLDLYRAARARKTWAKARQALGELSRLEPPPRSTKDLTPGLIARFVGASRERGRADTTTDSLLRSIAAACSYAAKMGYVRASPFAQFAGGWGLDTEPAEVPRHLSLAELAGLMDHLRRDRETWHARRLYALAATVAYTGLRRSEALHLGLADVDLASGFLSVPRRRLTHRAKTRASAAPVPIPPPLVPILLAWMPEAGPAWLFPGATRKGPWTGGPPGRKPLDMLKAAGKAAGIRGPVTFQALRHSFGTHAGVWGLDPIRLKQVLRHTTLRTQRHYIHPDAANLRDAVKAVRFG